MLGSLVIGRRTSPVAGLCPASSQLSALVSLLAPHAGPPGQENWHFSAYPTSVGWEKILNSLYLGVRGHHTYTWSLKIVLEIT